MTQHRNKKSKRSKSKKSKRTGKHRSVVYPTNKSLKTICRSLLSNKISINMKEYKSGNKKIKSPLQAIAVAYSQIKKKYPECSKSLKRTRKSRK
uniref:Uncharacterized protein n=1 Tax=viral metagenome TaxID=1070528 RepID=A0A6C0I506_9ZZZZ